MVAIRNRAVQSSSGASSVSVTMPSGYQTGDLLLVYLSVDSSGSELSTASSGWTRLETSNFDTTSGTLAQRYALFAKIATGSDALSVSFGGSRSYIARTFAIQDHSVTDVTAIPRSLRLSSTLSGTAAHNAVTGLDATRDHAVVALYMTPSQSNQNLTSAAPSGYSEYWDLGVGTNAGGTRMASAENVVAAGPTSITPGAWTLASAFGGQKLTVVAAVPDSGPAQYDAAGTVAATSSVSGSIVKRWTGNGVENGTAVTSGNVNTAGNGDAISLSASLDANVTYWGDGFQVVGVAGQSSGGLIPTIDPGATMAAAKFIWTAPPPSSVSWIPFSIRDSSAGTLGGIAQLTDGTLSLLQAGNSTVSGSGSPALTPGYRYLIDVVVERAGRLAYRVQGLSDPTFLFEFEAASGAADLEPTRFYFARSSSNQVGTSRYEHLAWDSVVPTAGLSALNHRLPTAVAIPFAWSGLGWYKKDSGPASVGPGPNRFRAQQVATSGTDLVFTVENVSGTWYSGEILSDVQGLGYGKYEWVWDTTKHPSTWDQNPVWGMFVYNDTYDPVLGAYPEIDWELAQFGDAGSARLWASSHPPTIPTSTEGQGVYAGVVGPYTSTFWWQNGLIYYRTTDSNGVVMGEHQVTAVVPTPGGERVHMNLWLLGGSAPTDGLSYQVTLKSFNFVPGATEQSPVASTRVNTFDYPNNLMLYGPGTSISGGMLSLPMRADYGNSVRSGSIYDLNGSSVYVRIDNMPSGVGEESEIELRYNADNQYEWIKSGTALLMRVRQGGVDSITSVTYDPGAHKFLRYANLSGDTMTFDASPDGTSWTTLRTFTTTLTVAQRRTLQLNFVAGAWQMETVPGVFRIDSINGPASAQYAASGTVNTASYTQGTIIKVGPVAGTSVVVSAVTGSAVKRSAAAGTTVSTVSVVAGSVTSRRPAQGAVTTISDTVGTVTARDPVSGSVATTSTTTGEVFFRFAASGAVIAVSGTTGWVTSQDPASGSVGAVSAVSGALTSRRQATGAVSAVSDVLGTGSVGFAVSGSVVVAASIVEGTATSLFAAAGTVVTQSTVDGTVTSRRQAGGVVTTVSTVAGAATKRTTASAGASVAVSTVSGALASRRQASGAVGAVSVISGAVSRATSASAGAVDAVSDSSGVITARYLLTSASGVVATSSVSGIVSTGFAVAGTSEAVAVVSGNAEKTAYLVSGVSSAASVVGGSVSRATGVAGETTTTSQISGTLTRRQSASGTIVAVANTAGAVASRRQASSQVSAVSAVSGAATSTGVLSGTIDVVSTVGSSAPQGTFVAQGAVATVSTTQGGVAKRTLSTGTVVTISTVGGTPTKLTRPTGAVVTTSTVSGTPFKQTDSTGAVSATSAVSGDVTSLGSVSGQAVASASSAGSVVRRTQVSGAVVAGSETAGNVSRSTEVSGIVSALSSAAGALRLIAQPTGAVDAVSVVAGESTLRTTASTDPVAAVSTVSGAASPAGSLGGSVVAVSASAGAVTKVTRPTGAVGTVSTVSGTPTKRTSVSGTSISAVSVVEGTATARLRLSGSVETESTVTGDVTASLAAEGIIGGVSTVVGTPTKRTQVSGAVSATSTVTGAFVRRTQVSGAVSATSTVTGDVTKGAEALGGVEAVSGVSGAVTRATDVVGAVTALSTVSGDALSDGVAEGRVQAVSAVTGTTTLGAAVSGSITATSTASGAPRAIFRASGVVTATSTTTGAPQRRLSMAGSVGAVSATAGTITARYVVEGTVTAASTASGSPMGAGAYGVVVATSGTAGTASARYGVSGSVSATSTGSGNATRRLSVSGTPSVATSQIEGTVRASSAVGGESVDALSEVSGWLSALFGLEGEVTALSTVYGMLGVYLSLFLKMGGEIIAYNRDTFKLRINGQETSVGLSVMLNGEEHEFWPPPEE